MIPRRVKHGQYGVAEASLHRGPSGPLRGFDKLDHTGKVPL
jgi:hypothetical protein